MSRPALGRVVHSRAYICPRCIVHEIVRSPTRRTLAAIPQAKKPRVNILSLLEERGYINQIAGDRNTLDRVLQNRQVGFYAGVDPTAPSLHLGHLLPFMILFWLYVHGQHVVSLIGEATARVGDPSGRLTTRATTSEDVQRRDFEAMYNQTGHLWENVVRYGKKHGYQEDEMGTRELLSNATWLDKLNVLDFLKMLGNGMRMGAMLGRDTVKNKMERGDGMSFSELTYPLLQGWDWWHMYRNNNVQVQVGGSDQYGNIVAGMDAVKYIAQSPEAYADSSHWLDANGRLKDELAPMGLTVPLLTTSSGEKFGKSAGNAIWLDRTMTSSFDLYGFLLRSSDVDVERYLKLFTFIPVEDIGRVMAEHKQDPGKRKAQHLLSSEVLELVHGREEAEKTKAEHQALRSPSLAFSGTKDERVTLSSSLVFGTPFSKLLHLAGLVSNRSEGSRLIARGGAYVAMAANSEKSQADAQEMSFVTIADQNPADLVKNGLLVLRAGKWKVRVIEVVDDGQFHTNEAKPVQ